MLHILWNLNMFMPFGSMTLHLRSKIKTLLKNIYIFLKLKKRKLMWYPQIYVTMITLLLFIRLENG